MKLTVTVTVLLILTNVMRTHVHAVVQALVQVHAVQVQMILSTEGSGTNGQPQNIGKRGKRKYSDASDQATQSEPDSTPNKRKLRTYLKKKPNYAVDRSSSEEGEGGQDSLRMTL